MDRAAVVNDFKSALSQPGTATAIPVAAITALLEVIKRAKPRTAKEISDLLNESIDQLKRVDLGARASVSIEAGTDLFLKFVTRCNLEYPNIDELQQVLLERGRAFLKKSIASRRRIAQLGEQFVHDGSKILVHGSSRVVRLLLDVAAKGEKHFSVIVPEGRPVNSGFLLARSLSKSRIPVTIITDSAVAHAMAGVDMVLVGAEAVVESGGIINQVGTYQIAVVASALGVPVYVAAEIYKFWRHFPLNQSDLPEKASQEREFIPSVPPPDLMESGIPFAGEVSPSSAVTTSNSLNSLSLSVTVSESIAAPAESSETRSLAQADDDTWESLKAGGCVEARAPSTDYTPAQFITLLFTDVGVLTPSAVSDELIKMSY